ncbi:gamma-glutamylcyclotransferase-like [Artemia franciscana]|uniref:gamma-glutamylcyclotransferase n=1 Tax=Artemia franciscana TaxID=6661 RepID=A0AA88IAV4_ARTSF|nr:hypothetical protein QYM36_002181 [Artemia franciscana]
MSISKNTFLYFAYGSNLLKERIHINNPSAKMKAVARLSGYQLDFNYFSSRWNGAVTTITKTPTDEVWGIVWEMDMEHRQTLNRQEGVHTSIYRPITVKVETREGETYVCRCYELIRPLEEDRRPSRVYKEVIIKGAIQNSLPDHYIHRLEKIVDNAYDGVVEIREQLINQHKVRSAA